MRDCAAGWVGLCWMHAGMACGQIERDLGCIACWWGVTVSGADGWGCADKLCSFLSNLSQGLCSSQNKTQLV